MGAYRNGLRLLRVVHLLAAGADVGAVADDAVTDQRPRADPGAEPDDGPLDHRPGLDLDAVEDHRTVQPGAGADLRAAAHHCPADQQRTGRHRGTLVHQALAAMPVEHGRRRDTAHQIR